MSKGKIKWFSGLFTAYYLTFNFWVIDEVKAQDEEVKTYQDFVKLCETLKETQDYENALKACEEAIAINRNDPKIWTDHADILLSLQRYPEALISYDQVLRQTPQNSYALTQQCTALLAINKNEEANETCFQALKVDQNWGNATATQAWYNRGLAFTRLQEPEEAFYAYEWATKLNPDYTQAWTGLCNLELRLTDYTEALNYCDRALQTNPEDSASLAQVWLNKARIFKQLKQYGEALNAYTQALSLDAEDPIIWTEQGVIYGLLGKPGDALVAHNWALEIKADYAQALVNKCAILNRLGQYEEAQKTCETALQESDRNWGDQNEAVAWNQRGNALTGQNKYEEALVSFQRAIAINSNYSEPWSNRVVPLWRLGRFDDALASSERAIALDSNSSLAWYNYGRILTTQERYDDAVAAYKRAIEGSASFTQQPPLAEIWINQSAVLVRLERYQEALTAANNAIAMNPESAKGWYNKAIILVSLKQYQRAVESYDQAIQINPENADFLTGKGIALRLVGSYAEALANLQKALELNPDNALAQENLEFVQQQMAFEQP
ncbi:MAG: tetratricopeptide repeat protein [Chroococcales cyanobacterium]